MLKIIKIIFVSIVKIEQNIKVLQCECTFPKHPPPPIQCAPLLCPPFDCAVYNITFPDPWVGQPTPLSFTQKGSNPGSPLSPPSTMPHSTGWVGTSPIGPPGILCSFFLSHWGPCITVFILCISIPLSLRLLFGNAQCLCILYLRPLLIAQC